MKIAIVHYHFQPGGVTQVVLNHLAGLASRAEDVDAVYLLHGGNCDGIPEWVSELPFDVHSCPVEGLGYDSRAIDRSVELARDIAEAISSAGGQCDDTVLHIHNHSLGKNASMPGAVGRLAAAQWPIVLQIHDFAEDYRPANYQLLIEALQAASVQELEKQLYPQAGNIHYAALTARDLSLLHSLGIESERLHLLANSVVTRPPEEEVSTDARERVAAEWGISTETRMGLYPVRGIRRKNVGEMLLWSAVAADLALGITLAPTNPIELKSYRMWQRFAEAKGLPAYFDVGVGDKISYAENQAAADFMFTSSVAEGFGMVFLEGWLTGSPLFGRDLPGVTEDFRAQGLEFPGLAPALQIPTETVGISAEPQIWEAYCCAWQSLPDGFIDNLDLNRARPVPSSEHVDFARLTVGLQARVIDAARSDRGLAKRIVADNPSIASAVDFEAAQVSDLVQRNAQHVRDHFSPEALADRMLAVYQKLLQVQTQEPPTAPPQAGQLFAQLAGYESFTPCRTLEL